MFHVWIEWLVKFMWLCCKGWHDTVSELDFFLKIIYDPNLNLTYRWNYKFSVNWSWKCPPLYVFPTKPSVILCGSHSQTQRSHTSWNKNNKKKCFNIRILLQHLSLLLSVRLLRDQTRIYVTHLCDNVCYNVQIS